MTTRSSLRPSALADHFAKLGVDSRRKPDTIFPALQCVGKPAVQTCSIQSKSIAHKSRRKPVRARRGSLPGAGTVRRGRDGSAAVQAGRDLRRSCGWPLHHCRCACRLLDAYRPPAAAAWRACCPWRFPAAWRSGGGRQPRRPGSPLSCRCPGASCHRRTGAPTARALATSLIDLARQSRRTTLTSCQKTRI